MSIFTEVTLAYQASHEFFDPRVPGQGQDRRVFHRVMVKVPCGFSNPVFGLETTGNTVDVSLDGMGVMASVNWSAGNRVRIRMDEIRLQIDGIIAFRKEEAPLFRYGVRFQKTGIFQILKLRRFLKQHYSGALTLST